MYSITGELVDVSVDTITGQGQLILRSFSGSETQNQSILSWNRPTRIESNFLPSTAQLQKSHRVPESVFQAVLGILTGLGPGPLPWGVCNSA